jgi:hypothetical protein
VTYFLLFIFENDVHVPPDPLVQRHGSADPDLDPDPPPNVMDPQHWLEGEDRVGIEAAAPPTRPGRRRQRCRLLPSSTPRSVRIFASWPTEAPLVPLPSSPKSDHS